MSQPLSGFQPLGISSNQTFDCLDGGVQPELQQELDECHWKENRIASRDWLQNGTVARLGERTGFFAIF